MRAFHYVLAPVALPQAIWVRRRAPRLAEPIGPRAGRLGPAAVQGDAPVQRLRLLITGDSSAAGVGVAHQDDALSGHLARRLAQRFDLSWRLHARCGATAATTITRLQAAEQEPFDAALIGLGVNDAKNGMTVAAWRRNYTALLDLLHEKFGVRYVYASGLPPVRDFPLLPWPTRSVVGTRADIFDEALAEIVDSRADRVRRMVFTMPLDASVMAEDGFHPGPLVYAEWARLAAEMIEADFPPLS